MGLIPLPQQLHAYIATRCLSDAHHSLPFACFLTQTRYNRLNPWFFLSLLHHMTSFTDFLLPPLRVVLIFVLLLPQLCQTVHHQLSNRAQPIRQWLWTAQWPSIVWYQEIPPPPSCGGRMVSWCPHMTQGSNSLTRAHCRYAMQR